MSFMDEYVDVAERVQEFYAKYPEGSLQPLDPYEPYKLIEVDGKTYLVYVAAAYRDPHDPKPGIGSAWELVPGRTSYTQHSELMVAETSSWGRALAALGFATKRIATKQEVEAAASRKVERITKPEEPIEDAWSEPAKPKHVNPFLTCQHGDRVRRTGNNARGPWVGYFCPQPKGSPDQCAPKFEGA